jgi:hypothetical protein
VRNLINCGLPNITAMIISRRMKWKWHATHLTEMQMSGNMKEMYTCVELGADGWVALTYILKRERERERERERGRRWTGFTWFRIWINDELL